MNTSAEVELKWADGDYLFALKLKQLEELQKVCGAPFGVVATRVFEGQFDIRDIYHTIRLGLIGGGLAATKASELCNFYVDGKALAPANDPSSPFLTAKAILQAVYFGIGDLEPVGEQKAGPP